MVDVSDNDEGMEDEGATVPNYLPEASVLPNISG